MRRLRGACESRALCRALYSGNVTYAMRAPQRCNETHLPNLTGVALVTRAHNLKLVTRTFPKQFRIYPLILIRTRIRDARATLFMPINIAVSYIMCGIVAKHLHSRTFRLPIPQFDFKFSTKVRRNPVQYLYERALLRFIVGKQSGSWSGVVVTSF